MFWRVVGCLKWLGGAVKKLRGVAVFGSLMKWFVGVRQ